MKHLLPLAAVAALFATACADSNTYTIQGTTSEPDGTVVYLSFDRTAIDSTTVENGTFTLKGVASKATMAVISCGKAPANQFFLEPATLHVDMDKSEVTGSPLNDDYNELGLFINGLRDQLMAGASEDSIDQVYYTYLRDLSDRHVGDPLGLMVVQELADQMTSAELDSLMALSPLYKDDARLQKIIESKAAVENTKPGQPYIDVKGINATTGEEQSLSEILAQGKPVVVDFWASWCGPCRREISNHLSLYAKTYEGRASFVGIAVWENSIDDTRRAMTELPISWPVIYAGDRTNSPTEQYGIMGIPHILLIGPDGTILARDLRGPAIATAIDDYLSTQH